MKLRIVETEPHRYEVQKLMFEGDWFFSFWWNISKSHIRERNFSYFHDLKDATDYFDKCIKNIKHCPRVIKEIDV